MLVSQNGYNATRVRIQHRALGTIAGLLLAAGLLQLQLPEGETLSIMLVITLLAYPVSRKNYGLSVIGFTVTAVYTLQLLALNGSHFLVPRLIDTLIGCVLAFGGTIWLCRSGKAGCCARMPIRRWRTIAALRLMLKQPEPDATALAYTRMQVNQAHNALFTSLNQAMQEPGFASNYLADMRLWVTHSQFIVEHLNAMTILAREHYMLTPKLAEEYLQACEIALQSCQQRLEYDGPSSGNSGIMQPPDLHPDMPVTEMERHLRRILSHLSVMHTISSLARASARTTVSGSSANCAINKGAACRTRYMPPGFRR